MTTDAPFIVRFNPRKFNDYSKIGDNALPETADVEAMVFAIFEDDKYRSFFFLNNEVGFPFSLLHPCAPVKSNKVDMRIEYSNSSDRKKKYLFFCDYSQREELSLATHEYTRAGYPAVLVGEGGKLIYGKKEDLEHYDVSIIEKI